MPYRREYSQRSKRRHLLLYLDVVDYETQRLIGHLGDISDKGLLLLTEMHLPVGLKRKVSIMLPDIEEFEEHTKIDIIIETRWTHPDKNPKVTCVGCLFLDIDKKGLDLIDQLEAVLGFD